MRQRKEILGQNKQILKKRQKDKKAALKNVAGTLQNQTFFEFQGSSFQLADSRMNWSVRIELCSTESVLF